MNTDKPELTSPSSEPVLVSAFRLRGAVHVMATSTGPIQHRLELAWRAHLRELDLSGFPRYDRIAFSELQSEIPQVLEGNISLAEAVSKERATDLAEKLMWIADEIVDSFVYSRQKFLSSLAQNREPLDRNYRERREPADERLVELQQKFSEAVFVLVKSDGSLPDRLSGAWSNHIRGISAASVPEYFSRSVEHLHQRFGSTTMVNEVAQHLAYDLVVLRDLIMEAAIVDHHRWAVGL